MNRTRRRSAGQVRADLDAIRDRVDLTVIAPRFGVVRKGHGWLCPFHDDHSPSLGVWKTWFECFMCGAKGDCFALAARRLVCPFKEAVEAVCEAAGLASPFGPGRSRGRAPVGIFRPPPPAVRAEKHGLTERSVEVLTWFAELVRLDPLGPGHSDAARYLAGRGLSPRTALTHGLGFVGDYAAARDALLGTFPLADLQAAGLFNPGGNLRFYRHRLILPFRSGGRVVGLQARNVGWRGKADGPKELTPLSPAVPFNRDVLSNGPGRVYLAEGVIDCLSLLEVGLDAVGVPGAHAFKPSWVALFDRAGEVVVAFDNDAAGREGTLKISGLFAAGGRAEVNAVHWPEGVKDANEFLKHISM